MTGKGKNRRGIHRTAKRVVPLGIAASALMLLAPVSANATTLPSLQIAGDKAFSLSHQLHLAQSQFQTAIPKTYQQYRSMFPQSWDQLNGSQNHNSVFSVPSNAPSFLTKGSFWAAPLTGDEYLRLARAFNRYPQDGGQAWGAEVAQWLGNVTGVSVVDGIVYVEESNNKVYALDAATGQVIWQASTINANMGDTLVENINGTPVVFVAAGDVGFTVQNALGFANGGNPPGPTVRGANFSAVYALNGLTGKTIWKFDTKGEAMPTPVYHNGSLFFDTGDGHLYAVDATTGQLQSSFQNPGFSSMSSANWYIPTTGPWANHLLIIYGTQDQNYMMAVDESNPSDPKLAWKYQVPNGINTGMGDVPPVVDPTTGVVMTDALVNDVHAGGTKAKPILNLDVLAINAATGQLMWSHMAQNGLIAKPVAFKGSVPMVHNGVLYVGDLLNETYQAWDEATGQKLWSTQMPSTNGPAEPRASAAYYDGKLIEAAGRVIYTIDPATGQILNTFTDPGFLAVWGIAKPVIVGNELYIGSISGWVFAMPAKFVMTTPGFPAQPLPSQIQANLPVMPKWPSYFNPMASRFGGWFNSRELYPSTWTAYAGGPNHNAYVAQGPSNVQWQTPFAHALPLNAAPRDVNLFGQQTATVMTRLAMGVGTGVTVANGMTYVGDGRYTIAAVNATTGQIVWKFNTMNNNFGQPLVTPNTVVVSSGDPWFNFAAVQQFATNSPAVHIGASFQALHGLNPLTGQEKWTFYTRGTDMMTPLYYNGNLYWVNGDGNVWAINANTGKPLSTFVDSQGNPKLHVGGYNITNNANIYMASDGTPIMVVGTTMPGVMYGINLNTDAVVWQQKLSGTGYQTTYTGFSDATPVVDQKDGIVVTDTLVNAGSSLRNATLLAVGMNAQTGAVEWTKPLGSGPIPDGFTASTPVYQNGTVYLGNPLNNTEAALNVRTGQVSWQTNTSVMGVAPGVIVGSDLIQPAGPDLLTFDVQTGKLLHTYTVGGDVSTNNPTVLGSTLYIGNGYGWAMAIPVNQVTGARVNKPYGGHTRG